jgi:excisionase family DNA binding protein
MWGMQGDISRRRDGVMDEQQLLFSRVESLKALGGISLRKLELLIAAKELKTVRIGKRVMISKRALEEFIRRNTK